MHASALAWRSESGSESRPDRRPPSGHLRLRSPHPTPITAHERSVPRQLDGVYYQRSSSTDHAGKQRPQRDTASRTVLQRIARTRSHAAPSQPGTTEGNRRSSRSGSSRQSPLAPAVASRKPGGLGGIEKSRSIAQKDASEKKTLM
jgi:hypothetical protein